MSAGGARVLAILPVYEEVTSIWNPCHRKWLESNLPQGVELKVLYGSEATAANVKDAIQSFDPDVITGACHGKENTVVVQDNEVLFTAGDPSVGMLKGRCWKTVSCLVGVSLLPWMEQNGLGAGLGEKTDYWFTVCNADDPCNDECLMSYIKSEESYLLALLSGYQSSTAYNIMLNAYEENAEQMDKYDPMTAALLRYDAQYRALFGRPDWLPRGVQPNPSPPPVPPKTYKFYARVNLPVAPVVNSSAWLGPFKLPFKVRSSDGMWSLYLDGTVYLDEGKVHLVFYPDVSMGVDGKVLPIDVHVDLRVSGVKAEGDYPLEGGQSSRAKPSGSMRGRGGKRG